ncbi:glyoxalase [Nocardia sp. CWNU-33]|uniref:glyoxalase n=1 Tax=Nocardia sp. CWNU-33 TaxID=3392117 RepID=UPI00398ED6C3
MNIKTETTTDINVHLEVADPEATEAIYAAAFGLGDKLKFRASQAPTTGFRGFMLSLVVSQPSGVDSLVSTALEVGFTTLKPAKKSFWGYGGVLQAPDGTIWKITTSQKKNTGPTTRDIDDFVLLLGVEDVKASKQFYIDHGLTVAKSFGSKYVEFATPGSTVTLAMYPRRAAAKDAGVSPEGTDSHRIVIGGTAGSFTDPDGFVWDSTGA